MKRSILAAASLSLVLVSGCKSAFIEADVHNNTGGPVTVLEVDYSGGSFGKEAIPANGTYHYRFKVFGRGTSTVSWIDSAHAQHTYKGPEFHETQEGNISITLLPTSAAWDFHVHDR